MAKKFTYITALLFFLFGIYMFNQEAGNKNSHNNSSIKEDSVILLRMPVNGVEKPDISAPSFYSTENFGALFQIPELLKLKRRYSYFSKYSGAPKRPELKAKLQLQEILQIIIFYWVLPIHGAPLILSTKKGYS